MNETLNDRSADDLVRQAEEGCYELIHGELVEKPTGAKSSLVAIKLAVLLGQPVLAGRLGHLFGADCGYQIFPGEPSMVRKPNVSFVLRGRLPNDRAPRGHMRVVPDLMVEVVSPKDLAEEVEERVADYLQVGVRLLWVVYPSTGSVWVFSAEGAMRLVGEQVLSGGAVIPGFSVPVSALFAPF